MALHVKINVLVQATVDELLPINVISGAPQLSVALINPTDGVGVVLHGSAEGGGHTITGAIASKMFEDVCVQVAEFPHSSVAVHIKVVITSQGNVPAETVVLTDNSKGQSSETVTVVGEGEGVTLHNPDGKVEHEITGADTSSTTVIV